MYAVDFDGVIADTSELKARWIADNLGWTVSPHQCDRTSCVPLIGLECYEKMSSIVYEREETEALQPVPDVDSGLRELSTVGPVHVVTARPDRRARFALDWIVSHDLGQYVTSLVSSSGRLKSDIIAELGSRVLIDDDVRHLENLHPRQRGILLRMGSGGLSPVSCAYSIAASWLEVLAIGKP